MSLSPRARAINPRLGIAFGIFASLFTALVLMTLMLEQLGISDAIVRASMLLIPFALIIPIGIASRTHDPIEYFAAGRRVPAAYCGIGLAVTAMGASGLVGLGGAFFFIGFDALCLVNAALAGFVVMAILLAPFFRKFGTFTIPTFLGRRFSSHVLRVTAGALLAVPTLLMLVAEYQIGLKTAQWLSGQPDTLIAPLFVTFVVLGVILGGTRALTWTNVAVAMAVSMALLLPVVVVAVMLGYLPIPQLSHGPVLRSVGRFEAVQAFPKILQTGLTFDLPADGFKALTKRFAEPFGSVSPLAFVLATLTVFPGIAAAPWLLPRVATAPSVYDARKSLGWATFFFALAMITVATIAVFMRSFVFEAVSTNIATPPPWLQVLIAQGLASVPVSGARLTADAIALDRDSILVSLPIAAGLPMVFAYLAAIGIVLAAFATACATAMTLANLMSEDILNGLSWKPAKDRARIITNQVLLICVAVFAGIIVLVTPTDPLKLMLWALALTGSSAFPVLVASVWWKRANRFGAFAGLITGFVLSVVVIVGSEAGWTGINGILAGVIALPMATLAMVSVSIATTNPTRETLELLRDIRVPGGEVVHDREIRLMKLKERARMKAAGL